MKKNISLAVLIMTTFFAFRISAQVNTEQYRKDSVAIGFTGNTNLEVIAITGNTDFQLLNIGGRLNYNYGDDYTFLVLDAGYGWEDGNSFIDQMFAHLRHVITPADLIQFELFAQYDNNKKRLLLNRELLGGGVRFKLLSGNNFKLRFGAAYMFEAEDYDIPPESTEKKYERVHRLSSYITFNYDIQENLSLVSVTYLQPKPDSPDDYRLINENVLTVILGKFIDLYIKFNLRYDSLPPYKIKQTDTVTKMGISFKF